MKKILLSLALCALPLAAWSQPVFQPSGKSVADIHETRTDETVVTAEADINKDGIKDLVIALDGYYSGSNFAFYFGDKNGVYQLFREYETDLYGDKVGITVNDKGVVRIQCDYEGNSDIFLFRWQDGDFRLIGGKKDRHASEHYDESYNYLTGKMIRTDGEGGSRKAVTTDMPKQPAINFGWIPLYYDMLGYLIEEQAEDDYNLTPDDMREYLPPEEGCGGCHGGGCHKEDGECCGKGHGDGECCGKGQGNGEGCGCGNEGCDCK